MSVGGYRTSIIISRKLTCRPKFTCRPDPDRSRLSSVLCQFPRNRPTLLMYPRDHLVEENDRSPLFRRIRPTSWSAAHLVSFRSCSLDVRPLGLGRNTMGRCHLHQAQPPAPLSQEHFHTSDRRISRVVSVCEVTVCRGAGSTLLFWDALHAAGTACMTGPAAE